MLRAAPHRAVGPALLNASQRPEFMDVLCQLLPDTFQMGRQDNLEVRNVREIPVFLAGCTVTPLPKNVYV